MSRNHSKRGSLFEKSAFAPMIFIEKSVFTAAFSIEKLFDFFTRANAGGL